MGPVVVLFLLSQILLNQAQCSVVDLVNAAVLFRSGRDQLESVPEVS